MHLILQNMPTLFVAHYGHPLLKGAKHWSFLLPKQNDPEFCTAYQVTGSTTTYEIKNPEDVSLNKSESYMGKVEVGSIEESRRTEFESVVLAVPVTRGNAAWHCQHWIIEVLAELKANGFDAKTYRLAELADLLAKTSK